MGANVSGFSIVEGDVVIRDASGNPIGVILDGAVYRFAVDAKVTSSALPTGAATEATLGTLATEATVSTLGTEATLSTLATEATLATRASEATLSTRASEATLGTRASEATAASILTGQTSGTQKSQIVDGANVLDVDATGRAAVQNPPNLDVAASTLATEATVSTLATEATAAAILADTASLDTKFDANLSTRATETTLAALEAKDFATETTLATLATEATAATLATEATAALLLTEAEFEARTGDVTASPASYTVLGRLASLESISGTLATEATAQTLLTEAEFEARVGTLGQKEMAGSTPVVLASDQSRILTESTIANEDGELAGIVIAGTRSSLSIEYPELLEAVRLVARELSEIKRHLRAITDEEDPL